MNNEFDQLLQNPVIQGRVDYLTKYLNGASDNSNENYTLTITLFSIFIENVEKLLAIELLNASQAIEFRRPLKSSIIIETMLKDFRKLIPFINEDKVMYQELEATLQFIKTIKV